MIIAGNWKMNGGVGDAGALALTIAAGDGVAPLNRAGGSVVLCVPFVSLQTVHTRLQGSPVLLGAQNCHWESAGAYTGEISAPMLVESGCRYVILGHSERRRDQLEDDHMIGKKALAAVTAGLTPIICVGESLAERENGDAEIVVTQQMEMIAESAGVDTLRQCLIAYEPVWAIGTGRAATPDQAQDIHAALRKHNREHLGIDRPILYGGSVSEKNADVLFAQQDINGALIGGASLQASSFNAIIRAAHQAIAGS